ncbi:galactan 5-O-arabinofuranosyltransferase [Corynebacterium pygosceleis]|uniref:galactan 5-O-arabinofuranosyltransferase n=1 Tax=Corynebacterium pygosceleis TaxID=2800406 RepID=UPI00190551C1|nr:galactan 5-O-arabinofuranosyltransferase [Corynebacterium pygosceleis]MCK7675949.1 galactan 5-O-arabinofuranosyltransferase [Corynebacterium pygosceleis]MCL0119925.1 galactan 5-O-arabinofuranosyltransferase [Corynebacterium pygosceleis]
MTHATDGFTAAPARTTRSRVFFGPTAPAGGADFTSDALGGRGTVLAIAAAGVGGGALTLVAWFILKLTSLPAFGGSLVSRALSTAGTVAVLLLVISLTFLWLRDEHHDRRRRDTETDAVRVFARGPGTAVGAGTDTTVTDGDADGPDPSTAPPASGFPDSERVVPSRPGWRVWLTYVVCYLSPAALVVTTLALPLSATRLYLDGITVDQGFRTQFLTRLTDSPALSDMNYIDMPSYYPGGWFWFGGRFANLLGLDGWAAFQPWALVSLAAAASMVVPTWQRLSGSLTVATGVGLTSICLVLVISPEEPYAAIVALGAPAATVLTRRALDGSRLAMLGLIIYLGASASIYTLYTGVIALSVVTVAGVFAAAVDRSWLPLLRMVLVGVCSMAIASVVWGPYLLAVASGEPHSGATAMHYLPYSGTQIPMPMFSFSAVGILCLLGMIFLVVRAVDRDVRAMGIALVVFYGWIVASMIATLAGNTLLGFRMDAVVTLQLATAGVFAIAEMRLLGPDALYPHQISARTGRTVTLVMVTLLLIAGVAYAQTIPQRNHNAIDLAYTDTDGDGVRADLYPPDAGAWYGEIDELIRGRGHIPRDTVVLTDEHNFMSYHPYRGFQAFTSHYANPLGEFDLRNKEIEHWATSSWNVLDEPARFVAALDGGDVRPPDVLILRGDAGDTEQGWKYDIAEDIYPNNPNVRFRGVWFNPASFTGDGSPWDVEQVGPFVVVIRSR